MYYYFIMHTATLSSKNQITLPKFLLEMVNAESGDKFLVSKDDEVITLRPIKTSIVEELSGSMKIPKSKRGIPFDKVREIVAKKVAHDIANS